MLAFAQAGVGFLQLPGAFGHPLLQFAVEILELAGLAVEVDEHLDLGAQHLGNHRHRDVVDRAHFVAAQMVHLAEQDGGDEDDGDVSEPGVLADHGGELETIQFRHADIDQDHRNVVLEKLLQSLATGRCLDQVLVDFAQDRLVAQQFPRLVVDEQDVDLVGVAHGAAHRCNHMRKADRSCSVLTGLAR